MKDVMGIIYTTKDDIAMRELTAARPVASLPVVGRYRMIDFMLSNMVNSGIKKVGIIVQKNYQSLMNHLGGGQEWNLHTKTDGLCILPPFQSARNVGTYDGTLDALRSNIDYLRQSKQEYIILTSSYGVFNMSYTAMLEQHERTHAEITVMYTRSYKETNVSSAMMNGHTYFDVAEDGSIRDLEIGPNAPNYPNFSMSVMIIKRTLLIHLLDSATAHGMHDVHKDLLNFCLKAKRKIMGFEFTGYYRCIESIQSYYQFNMDMLKFDERREMFGVRPVYTKVRDEVPAKYGENAVCENALVADGCIIEGTVIGSVISRGVRIGRGAIVKNCVLMQGCYIQEGVELENVILDKDVTVRKGRLIGQSAYPIVIEKGVTL